MRIVLTGGGSGGHFYPLIAVAQEIRKIAREEKLLDPDLVYMAPEPYDSDVLFEHDITFKKVASGKWRKYLSLLNVIDTFKVGWGIVRAFLSMYFLLPDVVFSKGGYPAVPVLWAARFFRIPVIIHESDSLPGRANSWASKFAKRIAISYGETAELYEKLTKNRKDKAPRIALTGNPVRHELMTLAPTGAREYLKLEEGIPTILVLGGSQGAQAINEILIEALPDLVTKYNIIHQTGQKQFDISRETANIVLQNNPNAGRYVAFPFLNVLALRMSAGVADILVSRAGSGSIFEAAIWKKPAIIIPIPEDVSHDQHSNAFAYARSGAAVVIEQMNLTPHLLISEINRLIENPDERARMAEAAGRFAQPEAARKIAREILDLALEHEK
ncbi:MAG: UDP-N-acetylglucosamine--N-acetylmuramyl-(pentapeptide) pyrophosphoryl-undecaprenol N-acetylglucosamine transferase [Patescibacteria group bacterium]